MTSALLMALCFVSGQWPGPLSPNILQPHPGIVDLRSENLAEAGRRAAALEQKRFEENFNRLTLTLVGFADQYNHTHTIDVKKIRAVKKAWRDLEKSEAWFKGK